ncbi:type-1 angiotensin II receptor-like [Paramacrobiotus metropolitanus]|uniref:type-1 angiotensin II receptor-like n=1 Tax=Paramacrobiotus metropolitanus TaxID=2943436 RepID=UPI002445AC40|nr:type-1 angiotensin II receptor-like [Paramacrobiotus metropolitanus]
MVNLTDNVTVPSYDGNLTNTRWNFVAGFKTFTGTTTLLMNTAVFLTLLTNRKLRTAFNIYLMNLLLSNIVYLVCSEYYDIIIWMKRKWWPGNVLCEMHLYALSSPSTCMTWAQVLISCNRIWAITFPAHYHHHHTQVVAIVQCVVMWLFVHTVTLPFEIMDALWYRAPGTTKGCQFNFDAQILYAQIYEIVMVDMTVIFIIVAYPYLLWKVVARRRARTGEHAAPGKAGHTLPESNDDTATRARYNESRTAFIVLTSLTVNAIVCWTPSSLVYLAADFGNYDLPDQFYQFGHWMLETGALMDSVIIFISVRDFRMTVYSCLGCR